MKLQHPMPYKFDTIEGQKNVKRKMQMMQQQDLMEH